MEYLRGHLERALNALWFAPRDTPVRRVIRILLAPLSLIVRTVARRRRAAIRRSPAAFSPKVMVIGNLIVGGTGKTPATIATARELANRGWRVGLLAGGYRAARSDARLVTPADDAAEHGDEPVLLASETGLPVAAGRQRAQALALLVRAHPDLDLVISDDGLQHSGLPRSIEVAVFDRRGAGNGCLLPAGPLREPIEVAAQMDALLLNATSDAPVASIPAFRFSVEPVAFRALRDGRRVSCGDFARLAAGRSVVALAGIAQPQRFFDAIQAIGIRAHHHPLPDHADISGETLARLDASMIVMTTKDAVKCRIAADDRCWALETGARLDTAFIEWIEERLRGQPIA